MFKKIIFITIFIISSKNLFALDWDKSKYSRPQDDSQWCSQVKPDTEEYDSLCEAAKTDVWERTVELKQEEFKKLIEKVSRLIVDANVGSIIHGEKYYEEWKVAFYNAQMSWLEQLELDAKAYWYAMSSLGGKYWRCRLRYKYEQLNNRIDAIKNGMWTDYIKDFL